MYLNSVSKNYTINILILVSAVAYTNNYQN